MSRRKEERKKGRGVYAECVNRDESGAEVRTEGQGRKVGWKGKENTEFKKRRCSRLGNPESV